MGEQCQALSASLDTATEGTEWREWARQECVRTDGSSLASTGRELTLNGTARERKNSPGAESFRNQGLLSPGVACKTVQQLGNVQSALQNSLQNSPKQPAVVRVSSPGVPLPKSLQSSHAMAPFEVRRLHSDSASSPQRVIVVQR